MPLHTTDKMTTLGSPHIYSTFRDAALVADLTTQSRGNALAPTPRRPAIPDHTGQNSHMETVSTDILPSGGTVPGAHLMPPTVGPGQLLFPKSPLPLPCPDVTFTGVSFSIYPIWGNGSLGMFLLKSEMNESMVTEYHTKSLATAWQLHSKRRVSAPCNCN